MRGPHVVATAFKRYFRELPSPIVPIECYGMFLSAADIPVHENQYEPRTPLRQRIPESGQLTRRWTALGTPGRLATIGWLVTKEMPAINRAVLLFVVRPASPP